MTTNVKMGAGDRTHRRWPPLATVLVDAATVATVYLVARLVSRWVLTVNDSETAVVEGLVVAIAAIGVAALRVARFTSAAGDGHADLATVDTEHELARQRDQGEASLRRALELAADEQTVADVINQAVATAAPGRSTHVLLTDGTGAVLRNMTGATIAAANAATANRDGERGTFVAAPPCTVKAPDECPAMRHLQPFVFASSDDLDACRHLRHRHDDARSAVCVPVQVMGTALGVVHVAGPDRRPLSSADVSRVGAVSSQAGARLGLLRAFQPPAHPATADPLTGLLDAASIEDRARELLRVGRSCALAIADLDSFRGLNDAFGRTAGDRALRLFASVLSTAVRPTDVVGRYGGQQFLVVFPDGDAADAVIAMERLREELALALADGEIPAFTASFGVADEGSGDTLERLVGAAVSALSRAKRAGRNRVIAAGSPPANT